MHVCICCVERMLCLIAMRCFRLVLHHVGGSGFHKTRLETIKMCSKQGNHVHDKGSGWSCSWHIGWSALSPDHAGDPWHDGHSEDGHARDHWPWPQLWITIPSLTAVTIILQCYMSITTVTTNFSKLHGHHNCDSQGLGEDHPQGRSRPIITAVILHGRLITIVITPLGAPKFYFSKLIP